MNLLVQNNWLHSDLGRYSCAIGREGLTKNKIEGDLKFFTVSGTAGSSVSRGFCEECGSQLVSFVEENPEIKFIKVGSLDDSSWVTVASNFWSSTAYPWSPADESIQTFTHNPDFV